MKALVVVLAFMLASCSREQVKIVHLTVLRNGQLKLEGGPPFAEAGLPSRLEAFKQQSPKPSFDLMPGEYGVPNSDLDRIANTIGKSGYHVGITGLVQP